MQNQLNSHQFPEVYKDLGINLDDLGCVMADVEPTQKMMDFKLPDDVLYTSKNPDRKWIKGWVMGETAHVTLLYGLLENAHLWEKQIKRVLKDWEMKTVSIEEVDYFDSQYEDDPYYCIVAHIKVSQNLEEGHERLQFLPHVDTFAGYKPHMTIAYIKKDKTILDEVLDQLSDWEGFRMSVNPEINLGYKPESKMATFFKGKKS